MQPSYPVCYRNWCQTNQTFIISFPQIYFLIEKNLKFEKLTWMRCSPVFSLYPNYLTQSKPFSVVRHVSVFIELLKIFTGDNRIWTGDLSICSRMLYHWAISPSVSIIDVNIKCSMQDRTDVSRGKLCQNKYEFAHFIYISYLLELRTLAYFMRAYVIEIQLSISISHTLFDSQ